MRGGETRLVRRRDESVGHASTVPVEREDSVLVRIPLGGENKEKEEEKTSFTSTGAALCARDNLQV